jgi:hypothetical protein
MAMIAGTAADPEHARPLRLTAATHSTDRTRPKDRRGRVPWRLLPARELGCGSGVTCWRRLRDWQQGGVWERLHHRLLDWLGDDGQVDWSRAARTTRSATSTPGQAAC